MMTTSFNASEETVRSIRYVLATRPGPVRIVKAAGMPAAPRGKPATSAGVTGSPGERTDCPLAQEKLRTASASLSWVSNTVSSFVIESRSVIRFVRLSSFILPPCRLMVV